MANQFALPKTPKPTPMGGNVGAPQMGRQQVARPMSPAGPAGLMGGGAAGPVRQQVAAPPSGGPMGLMGGGAAGPVRPPTGGPMQAPAPQQAFGALQRQQIPGPPAGPPGPGGIMGVQPNPGALMGMAGGALNRVPLPQGGPAGAFGALAGVQQRPMANVAQRPLRGLLGGM